MAYRTNILEQTVEYQSLDVLRLKTGQVVQITDESIDIWATAESHQRGDESNLTACLLLLAETANEDLLSNPYWTSHNIPTAVALHYDKAGWQPHCTGGGCDYPIYEFGPPLDSKSGGRRWEIWASHHNDSGAPDSPNEPVWAHLYDMEIDSNSTWWSLQFDSSAALTDFVARFSGAPEEAKYSVDVEQILAPFFASEFNSDRNDNEHRWNNIDLPISRFYRHHKWDYNVTGGGCNYPALWFGPVRKDADGNDARHLIMVGMEEDVGMAPEDITKPVGAVLYDECLRDQAGETEYIREFPSSLALINYVRTFDLETEKGVADIIADWHINSEICKIG
tara:strand:- start:1153 stop:2163 length:1011 start_codon:yes stop_codon:yes gene_type:complete